MKIGFFEVDAWAHEIIQEKFPNATISPEKLLPENAKKFVDLEVISPFIYSQMNKSALIQLPNLKFVSTRSTGYDHVDVEYCKNNNISVSNVPHYGSRTVAEFTFALILTLTRRMYDGISRTKSGSFVNKDLKGINLKGKTIGIIGFGKIGREVAKIAQGFEMNTLVYNRTVKRHLEGKYSCTFVDIDFLLERADVITLHVPLTPETKHIINKKNVTNLKKNCYLINTSRGGLIETEAILVGLEKEIFAGVGLDVLEEEQSLKEEAELISTEFRQKVDYHTLVMDHVIVSHPKVVVTPHNAFNSNEARERILHTTFNNINSFIKNVPQNTV